jgi:hypothetical protein
LLSLPTKDLVNLLPHSTLQQLKKDKGRMIPRGFLVLWWAFVLLSSQEVSAFQPQREQWRTSRSPSSELSMAKAAQKKKKGGPGGGGGGGSLKGFGSPASSKSNEIDLDRSAEARKFYDFLEAGGAGENLKRCGLGYFPLGNGIKLRGVVALKPIKKGDVIIRIPYELAANLGQEGVDPTGPGVTLLKDYCEVLGNEEGDVIRNAYYSMLPPFRGDDCMGSTDFFSDDALEALQAPLVVEETLKRRELTSLRFQRDIDESCPKWIDGTPVTEEHLRWAVWLITSRVLTVQGAESEGKSYRLLIPFLDMCNHDRSSPHILTGRAVPGGELKVVAGASVKEGEQINICYGGGQAGNSRMIQDYGFLDVGDDKAYIMDAQQLLGKRRVVEGVGAGRFMAKVDQDKTLDQLRSTTIDEDTAALEKETDPALRAAYSYRFGVKQALSKFIIL